MAMRDMTPRGRGGSMGSGLLGPLDMQSPMLNLRREIESLFEDMMRGGLSPFSGSMPGRMGGDQRAMAWPTIEVTQNDKELCIHAEVPGLSENDVELMIEDGVLTIRGEKKTETEDQERGYSERFYGQFERRIALPPGVDEDTAQADFSNGVLTITLQKTQQAERARRIPIGSMRGQQRSQPQDLQQAASGGEWQDQQQSQSMGEQVQAGQQQGQDSPQQGQHSLRSKRPGYEPPRQPQE